MPKLNHNLSQVLQNELATHALIDLALNFLMKQKINTWLDLEIALESLQSIYQPQTSQALLKEFLPRINQKAQAFDLENEPVFSDWLTPELDAELRSLFAGSKLFSSSQLETWIKHPLTKQIIQSFVEETLQRFIQKIGTGFEGKGLLGVAGVAGRGALGWAAKASRGALSGLGEQFQQQLSSATQDFISLSMNSLLDLLIQILTRPEITQQIAEAQVEYYDHLRGQPLSQQINRLFMSQPQKLSNEVINEWAAMLSDWFAYLLEHEALADLVGQLHQDLLNEVGEQSPQELINDAQAVNAFKESIKTAISPLVMRFAQQDEFQQWCSNYLDT